MKKMIICLMLCDFFLWAGKVSADVSFTGRLLDSPCQLAASSKSLEVTFYDTTAKQFNTEPARSPPAKFKIELNNCHITDLHKLVSVSFSGEEETSVPGTLKVSGVNNGRLSIQILDSDGVTPVVINSSQVSNQGRLIDSKDIVINYSAYVLTTPDALRNRSVVAGSYNAVATFNVRYQ